MPSHCRSDPPEKPVSGAGLEPLESRVTSMQTSTWWIASGVDHPSALQGLAMTRHARSGVDAPAGIRPRTSVQRAAFRSYRLRACPLLWVHAVADVTRRPSLLGSRLKLPDDTAD